MERIGAEKENDMFEDLEQTQPVRAPHRLPAAPEHEHHQRIGRASRRHAVEPDKPPEMVIAVSAPPRGHSAETP